MDAGLYAFSSGHAREDVYTEIAQSLVKREVDWL